MKSSSAIINKKDLNFSAGAARTGSTVAASACCMLTKSNFRHSKRKEVRSFAQISNSSWNESREFTTADLVILKVAKKNEI